MCIINADLHKFEFLMEKIPIISYLSFPERLGQKGGIVQRKSAFEAAFPRCFARLQTRNSPLHNTHFLQRAGGKAEGRGLNRGVMRRRSVNWVGCLLRNIERGLLTYSTFIFSYLTCFMFVSSVRTYDGVIYICDFCVKK